MSVYTDLQVTIQHNGSKVSFHALHPNYPTPKSMKDYRAAEKSARLALQAIAKQNPKVSKKAEKAAYALFRDAFYGGTIWSFSFLTEGWAVQIAEGDALIIVPTDEVASFLASFAMAVAA